MTDNSGDPFIVPPPGIAGPPDVPQPESVPAPSDEVGFIDLPPGIVDSGTYRMPASRQAEPAVRRPGSEPVFFPAAPGAPVAAVPATVPPVAVPQSAEEQEAVPEQAVAEETSLVAPRSVSTGWRLAFDGGSAGLEPGERLLVGRNPSHSAGDVAAELVPVDDPAKSVSKTHALIEVDDAGLWVTDLHSTNGTAIVAVDGTENVLEANRRTAVPSGSGIELGQFVIRAELG